MDWVLQQCAARERCVINLSGGGAASTFMDTIANDAVEKGVAFVAAAGNWVADSCNYSPGRARDVVGVASCSLKRVFSAFSGRGTCVKTVAPGENVVSAFPPSTYVSMSGTSMAAPVVAAAVARFWQKNPWLTALEVQGTYLANAVPGTVTGVPPNTVNAFVAVPSDTTVPLGWISSHDRTFSEWRREWDVTNGESCLSATASSAEFHLALAVHTRPLRIGKYGLQISANGKKLRLTLNGRVLASVTDDAAIRTRRVSVSNGAVTVSAMYEDRIVTLMRHALPFHPLHISLAGSYTVTTCDAAEEHAGRVETLLPPCNDRADAAACAVASKSSRVLCRWLGVKEGCRARGFCDVKNRNLCAFIGCKWKAGKCE